MPVKCPICGKSISNQGALNAHMQTHKSSNIPNQRDYFSYKKNNTGDEKKSSNSSYGGIIILLIIIALLIFWISPWFEKAAASGVLETKTGALLKPLFSLGEVIKDGIANTFRTLGKYASGEYQFSLESDVEESVKSGLEFGDFEISGIEFGGLSLSNELKIDTSIIVGKFDSAIENIKARISCRLGPENITGNVKSDVADENGVIILDNPGELPSYEQDGVGCIFPKEKISLPKKVNAKEIEMMLSYSLSPSFSLDAFVMDKNLEIGEKERLRRGEYDRISKMRYITDIDAKLQFSDKKPLIAGESKLLGIQFENKNIKRNNVVMEGFIIRLPGELSFEKCDEVLNFDSAKGFFVMEKRYLDWVSKQLNEDDGESDLIECGIKAPDTRGSVAGIAPLGKIEGKIGFRNTISKKQDVVIYDKSNETINAETTSGESPSA